MDPLTAEEARVAGSLVEKHLATPQYYPLTFNALLDACNQSNNRNPVVSYGAETVESALDGLRQKGLARVIHAGGGSRVAKYRHTLDEVLGLDERELALVAVLLLRGPQTVGELRSRTERMARYDTLEEVDHDLDRLASREPPLVVRLARVPGQKEARVATTLVEVAAGAGAAGADAGAAAGPAGGPGVAGARAGRPAALPVPAVPRLAPADPAELDDATRALLEAASGGLGQAGNLFATLARHPELFRRWGGFGGLLLNGALPARERELVILRVGWLCRAPYEYGQHVLIARRAGISDDEIAAVSAGPDAPGWTDRERAVLRAVDELHGGFGLTQPTWDALARHWDEHQLLELLFTVGQYHLVAMVGNAVGIQPEDGVPPLPPG